MEDAGSGLAALGGVVTVILLIVGVFWFLFPILVLSKMGEMLKANREVIKELKAANQWHARNDALQERISANTSALNPPAESFRG